MSDEYRAQPESQDEGREAVDGSGEYELPGLCRETEGGGEVGAHDAAGGWCRPRTVEMTLVRRAGTTRSAQA